MRYPIIELSSEPTRLIAFVRSDGLVMTNSPRIDDEFDGAFLVFTEVPPVAQRADRVHLATTICMPLSN